MSKATKRWRRRSALGPTRVARFWSRWRWAHERFLVATRAGVLAARRAKSTIGGFELRQATGSCASKVTPVWGKGKRQPIGGGRSRLLAAVRAFDDLGTMASDVALRRVHIVPVGGDVDVFLVPVGVGQGP